MIELIRTVDLPQWSMMYLEYADPEGLTDAEVIMMAVFYQGVMDEGYKHLTFNYGAEPSFEPYPEFGPACDCYSTEIWGEPNE